MLLSAIHRKPVNETKQNFNPGFGLSGTRPRFFVFLLFLGRVMYANEVETKKNKNYLR